MAEYTIDKIEYDGNVYKLQDNQSGYITVESDPVFSASAAAGISTADISNWNAKVSDDHKWNDVSLTKNLVDTGGADILIPYMLSSSAIEAKLITAGDGIVAKTVAIRDANGYIRAKTPSANDNSTKVATTAYVDNAVGGITIPSKTSDLTNDSGFIKQFIVTITKNNDNYSADKTFSEIQAAYNQGYEVICQGPEGTNLPLLQIDDSNGVLFELAAMSTNGEPLGEVVTISPADEVEHRWIHFTETDPVFSASPAAGISATDISNWNGKVSDTGKWNGVALGSGRNDTTSDLWIPAKSDNNNDSGTAYWIKATQELPTSSAVESVQIPRYKKIDSQWYLQSTTPSASDNSTKVATTAYVDAAVATGGTDEKLAVAQVSTNGTYYPIFGTGTAASTRQYDTTGFSYYEYNGTTSVTGSSRIILGNNTPAQTAGNKIGSIQIYGGTAYSYTISGSTLGPLANRTITLPDKTGTIALTSDVPSISLNGSSTTSASFYAPTTAGTSGYMLVSNGSGAPTWAQAIPATSTYNGNTLTISNQSGLFSVESEGSSNVNGGFSITDEGVSIYRYKGSIASVLGYDFINQETIVTELRTPTNNTDAATKKYVDDAVAGAGSDVTVTLNGSITTTPSFYAPATAGTSGQILTSNGSGGPTWINFPSIPTKTSDLTNDSGFITASSLPADEIEVVEYNVSTFAEVLEAYENGKHIFCKTVKGGTDADIILFVPLIYVATEDEYTGFVFQTVEDEAIAAYYLDSEGWSDNTLYYSQATNLRNGTGKASLKQTYAMAERKSQVAIGEYNVLDTGGTGTNTRGDYAFIIGNGTSSSARSNALTVDWEGNVNIPNGASYKVNGVAIGGSQVQIIRWNAS